MPDNVILTKPEFPAKISTKSNKALLSLPVELPRLVGVAAFNAENEDNRDASDAEQVQPSADTAD